MLPLNHLIHKPLLLLKFRLLESFRQFLLDGLLNNPRPRKTNESFRLL